ncbi:MAG: flagellar motor switch phosphatase FliY [Lachnospiraceae bacterium]|nr:flagellar motor switch phosphatase FliY [Lachnospiraceae bacterium]
MDGMLSQDEINALLSGMSLDDGPSAPESSGDVASSDIPPAPAPAGGFADVDAGIDQSLLSDIERDAIGEVANISMGTSATTLFNLVNQKVDITTPVVTLANWETVTVEYPNPCVFIQIKYTEGLNGSNILVLQERDVKVITDLMMGGDGSNTDGELGELHLSAISEAMNQMMGSSATSLSTMLGKKIDISPPNASLVSISERKEAGDIDYYMEGTFVKVAFHMTIGTLVDSNIIQLYPLDFAKSLYDVFMSNQMGGASSAPAPAPAPASAPSPSPAPQPFTPPPAPMPMAAPMPAPGAMPMMPQQPMMAMPPVMDPVNVQPATFQPFDRNMLAAAIGQENIGLIMDVPLEVTVELGRTSKTIKEILEFAPGTIIELDKIAGEPIDVLVNGKFVAKGEVVVIEESFGIRVTELIKD